MDIKPRPNHQQYLAVLRRMTGEQRLMQACALSDLSKQLLRDGLRKRYPELSEADLHKRFLERLQPCYNMNY